MSSYIDPTLKWEYDEEEAEEDNRDHPLHRNHLLSASCVTYVIL